MLGQIFEIYISARFWKNLAILPELLRLSHFFRGRVTRKSTSQSLKPIRGTASAASADLDLCVSGACPSVSYKAVL